MEDNNLKFQYAWEWFKYHANQRLTAFHFFLIIIGVIGSGIVFSLNNQNKIVSCTFAFFGALTAIIFWLLEIRNEELVNYGRECLKELEKDIQIKLSSASVDEERKMLERSMDKSSRFIFKITGLNKFKWIITHRFLLRFLFASCIILFLILFFYFLGRRN